MSEEVKQKAAKIRAFSDTELNELLEDYVAFSEILKETPKWFLGILKDLIKHNFYGKIIVEFQDGVISLVRKEETLKPPKK